MARHDLVPVQAEQSRRPPPSNPEDLFVWQPDNLAPESQQPLPRLPTQPQSEWSRQVNLFFSLHLDSESELPTENSSSKW